MNDINNLLSQFGQGSNTESSAVRIPFRVSGYIVPTSGAENIENTRILGVRTDTGEEIEVGFREAKGDRPPVSLLYSDKSDQSIETNIGGTLIIDGAYADNKLSPLSGEARTVYNGRWFNRVAKTRKEGYAIVATALVNPVMDRDTNNPQAGKKQAITIVRNDIAETVTDMNSLDQAIAKHTSHNMYSQDAEWYKRPGMPAATVRISVGDNASVYTVKSRLVEDAGRLRPATDQETSSLLSGDKGWQNRRAMMPKVFDIPGAKIEVLPSSSLSVGQKTVQKSARGGNSAVKTLSADVNGQATPHFAEYVIGVRRSPKTSYPIAVQALPVKFNPTLSPTASFTQTARPAPIVQKNVAPVQEQQAPVKAPQPQVSPAVTDPTPVKAESPGLTIQTTADQNLVVTATNPTGKQSLDQYVQTHGGLANPVTGAVELDSSAAPTLFKFTQDNAVHTRVLAPQKAEQPHQSAPQQPEPEPAAPDLNSLDLSGIDFEKSLDQAYDINSPTNNR